MKHVSVSPPPDELEHRLKDAYVRFADIDSRAVEAKKTCTTYISRVQPVIDCVKVFTTYPTKGYLNLCVMGLGA